MSRTTSEVTDPDAIVVNISKKRRAEILSNFTLGSFSGNLEGITFSLSHLVLLRKAAREYSKPAGQRTRNPTRVTFILHTEGQPDQVIRCSIARFEFEKAKPEPQRSPLSSKPKESTDGPHFQITYLDFADLRPLEASREVKIQDPSSEPRTDAGPGDVTLA